MTFVYTSPQNFVLFLEYFVQKKKKKKIGGSRFYLLSQNSLYCSFHLFCQISPVFMLLKFWEYKYNKLTISGSSYVIYILKFFKRIIIERRKRRKRIPQYPNSHLLLNGGGDGEIVPVLNLFSTKLIDTFIVD